MKVGQFERFYGEIRKLGRAQIKREKPHLQGQSLAETLYYRGFIGEGFDKVDDHLIGFIYVPSDLIEALPLHKTSFGELAADYAPRRLKKRCPELAWSMMSTKLYPGGHIHRRRHDHAAGAAAGRGAPEVEGERLVAVGGRPSPSSRMLLRQSDTRLAFMLGVGLSADLIARQRRQSAAQPQSGRAPGWRRRETEQIRALARAWLDSRSYRDMWHIPGLYPG